MNTTYTLTTATTIKSFPLAFAFTLCFASISKATLHVTPSCFSQCFAVLCFASLRLDLLCLALTCLLLLCLLWFTYFALLALLALLNSALLGSALLVAALLALLYLLCSACFPCQNLLLLLLCLPYLALKLPLLTPRQRDKLDRCAPRSSQLSVVHWGSELRYCCYCLCCSTIM